MGNMQHPMPVDTYQRSELALTGDMGDTGSADLINLDQDLDHLPTTTDTRVARPSGSVDHLGALIDFEDRPPHIQVSSAGQILAPDEPNQEPQPHGDQSDAGAKEIILHGTTATLTTTPNTGQPGRVAWLVNTGRSYTSPDGARSVHVHVDTHIHVHLPRLSLLERDSNISDFLATSTSTTPPECVTDLDPFWHPESHSEPVRQRAPFVASQSKSSPASLPGLVPYTPIAPRVTTTPSTSAECVSSRSVHTVRSVDGSRDNTCTQVTSISLLDAQHAPEDKLEAEVEVLREALVQALYKGANAVRVDSDAPLDIDDPLDLGQVTSDDVVPPVTPSTSSKRALSPGPCTQQPPLKLVRLTPNPEVPSRAPSPHPDLELDELEMVAYDALKIPSAYEEFHASVDPRQTVPPSHRVGDKLQSTVLRAWCDCELSDEYKMAIVDVLQAFTDTINKHAVHENPRRDRYRVDVFGSMAWGGTTGNGGDLDLIVIDKHLPRGYSPDLWAVPPEESPEGRRSHGRRNRNVPRVYHMYTLASIIQRSRIPIEKVSTVTQARTPILKFKVRHLGLECDMTVNDQGGWYNSALILAYCKISPYVFRPLIHTLKMWAARYNLNDPSGKRGPPSMSSYCLTLMAIAYLQHIGELPNLQEGVRVPERLDPADTDCPDVVWISWGREQGHIANVWFQRSPPASWRRSTNHLRVSQALRGFFKFFCGKGNGFNYTRQVVSVLNGGILNRVSEFGVRSRERGEYIKSIAHLSKLERRILLHEYDSQIDELEMGKGNRGIQPLQWDSKKIVVQDPFIWEKNCAGNMSAGAVRRFIHVAQASQQCLDNENATLNDLLSMSISIP